MHDERVEARTFLGFEDLERRIDVQRVSSKSVNRLRGQRHDLATLQMSNRERDRGFELFRRCGRNDLRVHFFTSAWRSLRALLTFAIASSALAPNAVRWPILRRGRGSVLP